MPQFLREKPPAPKGLYLYGSVGMCRLVAIALLAELESSLRHSLRKKALTPCMLPMIPGTGKTMLMDLFYDNVQVEQKMRIHFHAFMQDFHKRMLLIPSIRRYLIIDALPIVLAHLRGDMT